VIQRLQHPQEQPEILDWIIKGYKQLNQLENTIEYYQEKLKLVREKQDLLTEYSTLYSLGYIYFDLKQYPLAIDRFKEALNLEPSLENPYNQGDLNYMLGLIYYTLNQSSESIPHFERAIAVYEKQEQNTERQPANEANTYYMLGVTSKYVDDAVVHYREALRLYTELNNQEWVEHSRNKVQELERILASHSSVSVSQGDPQLDFLLDVLQAVADSQGNPQIVYPLLAKNLDKLDENLADILTNWATDRFKQVPLEEASNIAVAIVNFGGLIQQFPRGSRKNNLEITIAAYQAALEILTREAFPEQWAMTQINLATAYKDRIKGEKADNIEQAIASFQAALEILTRAAFPEEWATAQNNLAA